MSKKEAVLGTFRMWLQLMALVAISVGFMALLIWHPGVALVVVLLVCSVCWAHDQWEQQ